jgi:predicted Zn-dependent protease
LPIAAALLFVAYQYSTSEKFVNPRAGYDPRESINFWKRMEQMNSAKPRQFLSDHPSQGTRIQQLENWMPQAMEEYNKGQSR